MRVWKVADMSDEAGNRPPLSALDDSDREFVVRFVLASGSLKDVANSYGVSYPTIRARLDRLIARLEALQAGRPVDPMTEALANLVERGEMRVEVARALQELHRREMSKGG